MNDLIFGTKRLRAIHLEQYRIKLVVWDCEVIPMEYFLTRKLTDGSVLLDYQFVNKDLLEPYFFRRNKSNCLKWLLNCEKEYMKVLFQQLEEDENNEATQFRHSHSH